MLRMVLLLKDVIMLNIFCRGGTFQFLTVFYHLFRIQKILFKKQQHKKAVSQNKLLFYRCSNRKCRLVKHCMKHCITT